MATYIYDKTRGIMVNKDTLEPMLSDAERSAPLQSPRVYGDIEEYASPIDGSVVSGRRARRYDLEKNDCIDARDISNGPKKLKNERFAKKHGLTHMLEQKG